MVVAVVDLATAHLSGLVVPICYDSLGTELQALRLAAAAGLDICALVLILIVACLTSL
jgi:hypothetical protein